MTIASEITRIKTNIESAYTALEAKGATIPSEKNSANLASTVNTITTGGGSSGETNYLGRIVTEDGVLQFPSEPFSFSLPDYVTSIGAYGLRYAFEDCINLTSVDLSNVTSISDRGLEYAFWGCTNLTSVDLSGLQSIGGNYSLEYAFSGCTSLTSVDLSGLQSIGGNYSLQYAFRGCTNLTFVDLSSVMNISVWGLSHAFWGCTNLTSVDLSNLQSIYSRGLENAFEDCTSLTSVDLSGLQSIDGGGLGYAFEDCINLTSVDLSNVTSISNRGLEYAFNGCTSLKSLSFPALKSDSFGRYTNQFNNMLLGVTGCTVHFPWNLETVIWQWDDVKNGFGGINTVVLFDLGSLPCTIMVIPESNTEIYINNELKNSSDFPVNVIPGKDAFCIYNHDYPMYGGVFTADGSASEITLNVDLTTLTKRTLTINSNVENCTCTFNIGGKEFTPKTSTATTYSIDVADGTTVTYTVEKTGYLTMTGTVDITEDKSIDITMVQPFDYNLTYPFTDASYFDLTNLIGDTKFVIDETSQSLCNNEESTRDFEGSAYGYIKITVPVQSTLEVNCVSELDYWTWGAVYLGTQEYQPTYDQVDDGTTDNIGEYIYREKENNTPETVTATLESNKTYFLNFIYVGDSIGSSDERFHVYSIRVTNTIGETA